MMSNFFINTLIFILVFIAFDNIKSDPIESTKFFLKCGYEKCPKSYNESKLNIHLIPHTHDDVGWQKTFEQYYYGHNANASASVQYILDTVIDELYLDSNKKFIYVEMAFFWKWWNEQTPQLQNIVKGLVENGQLEFVGGGWSMNDEATTYYQQIIDQMTWGFRRLNDTFGECGVPKVAWQIDPFGHSKEQASLFAQMYFDGLFFMRLDYQDRDTRIRDKTLEFVWRGNEDLGKSLDLFTSIMELGYGYGSPPGVCWDLVHCQDERINDPVVDDPESEEYNVKRKVNDFLIFTTLFSQHYTTKHIYVPIGSDFQFLDAQSYFKNLDKIIFYINERQRDGGNVNVFYSTPSCYLQALRQANKTYQIKSDDFFPYGSNEHSYWTGYFTSRPALKYYERRANNILQACKQLNAFTSINMDEDSIVLKEALGVLQHHDAVSGTEKQHVANDYAKMLSKGIEKCKTVINEAYKKLLPTNGLSPAIIENQVFCEALNISACSITESGDQVAVTLYNPLGRQISQYIRLPISKNSYEVLNSSESVPIDVMPISYAVMNLAERKSIASNELVFKASVPPLGFATYFVRPSNNSTKTVETIKKSENPFTLRGKSITVHFDSSGSLDAITLSDGQKVSIKQSFNYYKGFGGNNKNAMNQSSGAYIFRPDGQTPINLGKNINYSIINGSVVQEVQQQFSSWVSQNIRVYPDEDYIEFDWVLGPIPVDDSVGKEIITRFDSSLNSGGVFYTDANGRQNIERRRNWASTYNVTVTEPVAANYYPVNSRIFINDQREGLQLTLLNDRSQGGSSLKDGSIELMLHRRLLNDDNLGVHEALDEPGFDGKGLIVRGKMILFLSKTESAIKFRREHNQLINLSPLISFAKYKSEKDYTQSFNTRGSNLKQSLPPNVHILTLEQWKSGSLLLRLEHMYSSTEDPKDLSKNITMDLKDLFSPFTIKSVRELSLGANQFVEKSKQRLVFRTGDNLVVDDSDSPVYQTIITLKPMQIRTFIVSV